MTIDDEPWFVGKDVADILGYSKARNAIALHVDEEDALKQGIPTSGGMQDMLIINESGLYSLILSSRLPQAKRVQTLGNIRSSTSYSQTRRFHS